MRLASHITASRRSAMVYFESDLIGSPVLGPAQGADRARNAGINIGAGTGNNARGKGRGIELMLGIKNERDLHSANPLLAGGLAMKQFEKVPGQRVLSRFHVNASSIAAEVMPVKQHGPHG